MTSEKCTHYCVHAVSYTHLDVYKRQPGTCLYWQPWISILTLPPSLSQPQQHLPIFFSGRWLLLLLLLLLLLIIIIRKLRQRMKSRNSLSSTSKIVGIGTTEENGSPGSHRTWGNRLTAMGVILTTIWHSFWVVTAVLTSTSTEWERLNVQHVSTVKMCIRDSAHTKLIVF